VSNLREKGDLDYVKSDVNGSHRYVGSGTLY
jgi:hypothetical protein